MSWRGCIALTAVLAWMGGNCLVAEEARKSETRYETHVEGIDCPQCWQEYVREHPPTPGCPACEACGVRCATCEAKALMAPPGPGVPAERAGTPKPSAAATSTPAPAAGAPSGAWLGVMIVEGGYEGVFVTDVVAGSPAAAAGLAKGDQVLLWGDVDIRCERQLRDLVRRGRPGDRVAVTLLRGRDYITAQATLGAPPGTPAAPAQPAAQTQPPAQQPPAKPAEQPPAEQPPSKPAEQPPAEQPEAGEQPAQPEEGPGGEPQPEEPK